MSNKNTTKSIFEYSTLGIQLAVFMILFVYGGFRLDNHLKTSPLFVALGAVLGLGSGLYNLLSGLRKMDRISRISRISKEESNNKQNQDKWL